MPSKPFALSRPEPSLTTTDQVFENLHRAIVSLELPPGTKLSEADMARQFDVSRQPVRDAFFRLSELGFLKVRPQRATLVSKISEAAVKQAGFIRIALELACLREAIVQAGEADFDELEQMIEQQEKVLNHPDPGKFHDLDDRMHRRICEIANHGYVWALIQEKKSHVDRVRRLSLPVHAPQAVADHRAILAAMRGRDAQKAEALLSAHLSRVFQMFAAIRAKNTAYFDDVRQ